MAIPTYETLILPVLKLASKGVIKTRDAVKPISDDLGLTEEEQKAELPSGVRYINDRMHWAITCLVKAGLVQRPQRGHFKATDKGLKVLNSNPERIDKKYLSQFPEFLEFLQNKNKKHPALNIVTEPDQDSDVTPEERIDTAHQEISNDIKSQLLDKMLKLSPEFFEKLVVKLLVGMGYGGLTLEAGRHLGKSGDGGIDGIINQDKLGLDSICIQAKRYATDKPVGRPAIQQFVGSLTERGAGKGVFVTTSNYSEEAMRYIEKVPQRIILINGDKLTDLMFEYNIGVRKHRKVEIKKIDEDFFDEDFFLE